jgi:hypothetical protein
MRNELKKAIIDYIFENYNVFNLNNQTTKQFEEYIYNRKGDYLIGGVEVIDFIDNAIRLIKN